MTSPYTASGPAYTTAPGESLVGIALRELRDESRWTEIRDLNEQRFPYMAGNDNYPVGTVLRMPDDYVPRSKAATAAEPSTQPETERPDMKALCESAARAGFEFPKLPAGIVRDPRLGDLFDRLQAQQYGLRVAEALLATVAPQRLGPFDVPGLVSKSNFDEGVVELRFVDDVSAQAFMERYQVTVDSATLSVEQYDIKQSAEYRQGHEDGRLAGYEAGLRHAVDNLRGLDTATRVRFYEHDFYVLSNFSSFNLKWKGHVFATSEHAYHWEKFSDAEGALVDVRVIRQDILTAPSAHEAFKIAERNKAHRRPDWDDVKVGIMREILRAKVEQHEYVRRKLLATGDRELVEDSWRDDFWGWGEHRNGLNTLGRLWMELRAELRAAPVKE